MVKFAIDPDRSKVWISAQSSLHPIHAETMGLEGWFEAEVLGGGRINPTVVPHARLELPVEMLTSGNALYDREMRRRVDARRFPRITGELTSMKEASGEGRYIVGGDLTFRGVTRSFEDEMTLSMPNEHALCLDGERVFDIRDFGMEPPRILTLRVHPEVTVKVAIVASDDGRGD
jgi:polyisoprenoid-binding protein YceI